MTQLSLIEMRDVLTPPRRDASVAEMELRHLRYFVVVAEECHFRRAAERLHIAESPLSQQIRQLESELGLSLFERTTRRVSLTAAGERFLERSRHILLAVDHACEEASRLAAGELGHLAIGFTGSATYELMPRLSLDLHERFPGIELDLKGEMLTPDQVEALLSGALDLGFLRPPVRDPRLEVHVLRSEPLIVALPANHRLTRAHRVNLPDLVNEAFISYPSHGRSVVYELVVDACRHAGFAPRIVEEVAETSTLISFVAAGLGLAVVPASVANLRLTGTEYRPIIGDPVTVELAVAMRADDPSSLSVKARDRAIEIARATSSPVMSGAILREQKQRPGG
jgi:DNA-binding transcriptional LysR family regulator